MTTLFLIRHGENDYLKHHKMPGRLPGIHLNERGREQAAILAVTLREVRFKAIYSSPLERAVETAQPLAVELGLEAISAPGLADTDVGHWVGRSWISLQKTKAWQAIQEHPSRFRFPGGESFLDAQNRTVEALESIGREHPGQEPVAIFCHADPIKLAVAHYLGLPLDHFQRLKVHTGSATILSIHSQSASLLAFNLIPPFTFPK
ncbi:MAG: histidine phosphatase family protein [Chloroflexi bacterium]|nr:histidine phosphatase family protein [Chloroflexota bacterium]